MTSLNENDIQLLVTGKSPKDLSKPAFNKLDKLLTDIGLSRGMNAFTDSGQIAGVARAFLDNSDSAFQSTGKSMLKELRAGL